MVVIAPGRARRPGAFVGAIEEPTPEELAQCPFCEGREDRTPPETLALPRARGRPGWTVRVVPNLYPALERQEVVVHSPRHVRSFAELEDAELELVAEAWRERFAAARDGRLSLRARDGQRGALRGRQPGSLALPARLAPRAAPGRHRRTGRRRLRRLPAPGARGPRRSPPEQGSLSHSRVRPRPVRAADRAAARVQAARTRSPTRSGSSRDAIRRLRALEGAVPWNAWLHLGPHWHSKCCPG